MTETVVPAAAVAQSLPANPYVGLVPYGESDAPFFFGREEEKSIVKANLRAARLTVLYGPSGVGKSSLLLAGVVHDLRAQIARTAKEQPTRAPFAICVFRSWRDEPLPALMNAIRAGGMEALGGEQLPRWGPGDSVVDTLRAWTHRVRTFLVVLDQFEDYFLYGHDEAGDGSFAEALPLIVNDENLRVNVLLSIREDAWAKLDRFEGQIPGLFENYVRVEHLTKTAARQAIEGPIAEWNRRLPPAEQRYEIEGDLVTAVVDAAASGRLALADTTETAPRDPSATSDAVEAPFLQLVMDRLWRATIDAEEHALTAKRLDDLGGAQRIVETHLLGALGALTAEEQAVAAAVFRFLVTRSKTKIAHPAASLAEWVERPEDEVVPVLEKLCRGESGRILRAIAPPPGDTEGMRYELYHDVLAEPILEWRKQYEQERAQAELAARHRAEERTRRDEEKQRLRDRRNRLFRISALILFVLTSALAAVSGLAVWNWRKSNTYANEARSQELASRAQAKLAIDPVGATRLAALAVLKSSTPQARGALEQALATTRIQSILSGHRGPVLSSTFSPNGNLVATAGKDGTVRTWDAKTGQGLAVMQGHTGAVRSVAFSSDGNRVVTASDDDTARIWDAATGRNVATLRPSKRFHLDRDIYVPFVSAAFSPDGNRVLTASPDGAARLWDVQTGKELLVVQAHHGVINQATLSADGSRIAIGTDDDVADVWDVARRQRISSMRGHGDSVVFTAFSPNGKKLVTAGADGAVRLGDVATGRSVAIKGLSSAGAAEARPDRIGDASAAFSPNGKLIYSVGRDGVARILNLETGRISRLGARKDANRLGAFVTAASFSPDSTLLVTAQDDGTSRVWDTASGTSEEVLRGPASASLADTTEKKRTYSAEFSTDGRRVVTTSANGTAVVWAVRHRPSDRSRESAAGVRGTVVSADGRVAVVLGERAARLHVLGPYRRSSLLQGEPQPLYGGSFSPDARLVVTTYQDGTARIWDTRTRKPAGVLRDPAGRIDEATFSRDGRLVVTQTAESLTRLWNAATRRPVDTLGALGTRAYGPALSPNGTLLVTLGSGARVWDVRTHRVVLRVPDASTATFGLSGQLIAAADSGVTRIWQTIGGKPVVIPRPKRFPHSSYGFSLSPGGKFLLARSYIGSGGFQVRVWDPRTGRILVRVPAVTAATFSSDDRMLATATRDGAVQVRDLESGAVRTIAHLSNGIFRPLALSDSHKLLLLAREDGTARILDLATGRSSPLPRGSPGPIDSAIVAPDGKYVATLSEGVVRVWKVDGGHSIVLPNLPRSSQVEAMAFNADGRLVATGTDNVDVWEAATGKWVPDPGIAGGLIPGAITGLRFSPDGTQVFAATNEAPQISQPDRSSVALNSPSATASAYAPSGRLVVAAAVDGTARIFSTELRRKTEHENDLRSPLAVLRGSDKPLDDVAFSPDGQRVATASSDGTAVIWTTRGAIVRVLSGHAEAVSSVAFSHDGSLVLTTSVDGTARLWDASTGQPCGVFGWDPHRVVGAQLLGSRELLIVHPGSSIERVPLPALCSLTRGELHKLATHLVRGMTTAQRTALLQGT